MQRVMKCLRLAVAATVICGCSKATPPNPPAQKPAAFRELPVELAVKQRSTTTIPGSEHRLTVDDITRGQVMASIADADGVTALAAISLKERESTAFTIDGYDYQLMLRELENELIGDDSATFVISSASASAPGPSPAQGPESSTADRSVDGENQVATTISEREKIERLLATIEADAGPAFIRNEVEHSPQEAAEHLRAKWAAAGNSIETADDFIDKVASKSSLTGEPYRVRRADGTVVLASDYLRERLNEIDEPQAGSK